MFIYKNMMLVIEHANPVDDRALQSRFLLRQWLSWEPKPLVTVMQGLGDRPWAPLTNWSDVLAANVAGIPSGLVLVKGR